MYIKLFLCLLVFFKNNFHNKAKKVCIKTRSPSPSLPSLTVKWPIGSEVTDRAKVQGRFCSHFSFFMVFTKNSSNRRK